MAALLIFGMACLGMGNGAVFQLVPQRFQKQIGVATGVIGAVGGLGGFFLPNLLGIVKQSSGSFGAGFLVLAGVALGSLVLLRALVAIQQGWRASWQPAQSMN
jgi:NNP family nitrate/nitrite transporter-like MFS transporter